MVACCAGGTGVESTACTVSSEFEGGPQDLLIGRSLLSPSDPSEKFVASGSGAYLQWRRDFSQALHGRFRSHLSFRLRHSVHDLTGLGRFTVRACG